MAVFTKDRSFYRSLVTLAVPISLQNLVTFAVSFADNVMIGSLGDDAISGVYIGGQLQSVLQMFVGGIEGAILILAAQYWGKKDTQSIRKVVSIGIKFALAVGLLSSLVAVLSPSGSSAPLPPSPASSRRARPMCRLWALPICSFPCPR